MHNNDFAFSLCGFFLSFWREHSSSAGWKMIYEEASYRRRRSRLWTNENHLFSSVEGCVTLPTRGRRASVFLFLNPWLFRSGSPTDSNSALQTPVLICKKSDSCSPFNLILAALAYHMALIHLECNLQALRETCQCKPILSDSNTRRSGLIPGDMTSVWDHDSVTLVFAAS